MGRSLAWNPAVAIWDVGQSGDERPSPASGGSHAERHALAPAEALALVGQLRELDPDLLVLAGADPSELETLLDALARAGLRVALAPGPRARLSAAAVRRLAAQGVRRLVLELEAPAAGTHPGAGGATGAMVAAAHGVGLALQVDVTLAWETVQQLPRTAAAIERLRPLLWNVVFFVPVPGATSLQPLGPGSCERVFEFLSAWSRRTGIAVATTAAPAYRRFVLQREAVRREGGPHRAHGLPINDGKGMVFVARGGDVQPSPHLPLTTANVRDTPLAEVYRRSRLFRALRDPSRLEGRCGVCPFRSVCGGSRARAYAVTGNFLAEDPACAYRPADVAAAYAEVEDARPA